MSLIFMFPGQNSRYPGMIGKFAALHPANARLVERASDTLHRDLAAHFAESNTNQFARNRDVQVGVFLASHMLLISLDREGIHAGGSLGLSLGEYNHLVHIGALEFEDALRLLEARGDAYDTSPEGAMASVTPVTLPDLENILREHAPGVTVALHNTPRQFVIAGERAALDRALRVLEEDYFVQPVLIEERLPMHSPLFDGVAERFRAALEATPWCRPVLPYLPNATARYCARPERTTFIDLLARHVHHTVLWRESVETAAASAVSPTFVEVGPRAVLFGMMGRRWLDCPRFKTDHETNLQTHFETLVEELKVGQRDFAVADPVRQAGTAMGTRSRHAAG